jgi:hypothetical protein
MRTQLGSSDATALAAVAENNVTSPERTGERRSGRGRATAQIAHLQRLVASETETLLGHRYFQLCHRQAITREQAIEIVKQLYCFSVFFERIITRRISRYSSAMDHRLLRIARGHLREELGHPDLFHDCLQRNGMSLADIAEVTPKMFTKALFGYLLATLEYENEYVTNVAILQVMENIACHFFRATLPVMEGHELTSTAFRQHSEDDEEHATLGLDLAASFDLETMGDCQRIVEDLHRLMGFVLDEWLSFG